MPRNRTVRNEYENLQSRGYGQDYADNYRNAQLGGRRSAQVYGSEYGGPSEHESEYGYSSYVNSGQGVQRGLGMERGMPGRRIQSLREEADGSVRNRRLENLGTGNIRDNVRERVRSLREDVERNMVTSSDHEPGSRRPVQREDIRQRGHYQPEVNDRWEAIADRDLYRRPYHPAYGDKYGRFAMGGGGIWQENRGLMRDEERVRSAGRGNYGGDYEIRHIDDYGYNAHVIRSGLNARARNLRDRWDSRDEGYRESSYGSDYGVQNRNRRGIWNEPDMNDEYDHDRGGGWISGGRHRGRNF